MLATVKHLLTIILSFFVLNVSAQTWQDVGGGTNNSSHGMLAWNGKLVNLGSFSNPCNRVATWDGTQWECLGTGVGIVARAGCIWNGDLVVVGDFWNNGQPCSGCNGVAVWDGAGWTALDQGFNNDVLTCTVYNGDLIIGGDFTQANGVDIGRVAKWNTTGSKFETLGLNDTIFDNDVRCMTVFQNELWVGGDFNNADGNPPSDGVVKWDPNTQTWLGGNSGVDLVGGVNETVRVLYVNPNDGNLYMGGEFLELIDGNVGTQDFNMSGVAMYDGSHWTSLGTGLNEYCRAIHEYNGNLIVGGYFTTADGVACNKIAKWNGTTFSPMGLGFDATGIDEYVKSATVWNGIFFAGGAYTQAEGNPMNYIAQWYEASSNPPTAVMTPSATNVCAADCISFQDISTNSPTSWTWSFPGSNTPNSSDQHPQNICYSSSGTYTATLQACNANGCTTTNETITVNAIPGVTVNDHSICEGESITITATPSLSGGDFLWNPNGETNSSISVSPATTTSYDVVYTLNGCSSSSETSTVTVNPTPTVSVNNQTICSGESTTLTAIPSSGSGNYSWSPGGEVTQSINVSPSNTTSYTVEYTLGSCPAVSQTSTVTVIPTPSVSVNNQTTICEGESTTLTATPSDSGGDYSWSPNGETTQSITISPATTTSYSVIYTMNGCPSTSQTGTVTVNPLPDNTVTINEPNISSNQSNASYQWIDCDNGNSVINGATNQSYTATVNGSYAVEVTLNGCTSISNCEYVLVANLDDLFMDAISVYPNPTNELIFVQSDFDQLEFKLLDASGKVLKKGAYVDSPIQLNLISSGLYLLKLSYEEQSAVLRIIKN